MDQIFSLGTLHILAFSKIILFAYLLFIVLAWRYRFKPVVILTGTALALIIFYIVLAAPLKQMWWGTVGDELFITAYLSKVMSGQLGTDFYYSNLPNFYPPLYFWLTGLLATPLVTTAIGAAKIGVIMTLVLWFFGTYIYQAIFWKKIYQSDQAELKIINQTWFWSLLPIVYFLLLDFDTIIFKPYETLAALGSGVWLILMAQVLDQEHWPQKYYWWFGISGAGLFLLFYFWWFLLIPLLIVISISQTQRVRSFFRLCKVAGLMFIFSLPYLAPLLWSYVQYGIENWQAKFFVASDLFTYLPWDTSSVVKNLFIILALLVVLYFYQHPVIKISLWAWLACYGYQAIAIMSFVLWQQPIQAYKPFLFFGGVFMAVILTLGLIQIYQLIKIQLWQKIFLLVVIILAFSQLPMIRFIDNPKVLQQIEIDLKPSSDIEEVTKLIIDKVPDFAERNWLYSGEARFNAYLPLSYYLAHSPHFSHQASGYSQRLAYVETMTKTNSATDFTLLASQAQPTSIDALLLYQAPDQPNFYSIWLWLDNYPNGGKNATIYLPAYLISEQDWQLVAKKNNWHIFIKK